MTEPVPEISWKYCLQVDLRGRRLPVTINLPIMLDPSESDVVNSGTTIQQPQGVVTSTSNTNSKPLNANSRVENLFLLRHLSVSTSLRCALTI